MVRKPSLQAVRAESKRNLLPLLIFLSCSTYIEVFVLLSQGVYMKREGFWNGKKVEIWLSLGYNSQAAV